MVYHSIETLTKTNIGARIMTDLAICFGRISIVFGPCAGKATECSELNDVFSGSLEGMDVESNVENGGLSCEVSEESNDATRAFV